MVDQPQTAELDWTDTGVPIAKRFDDPYFSMKDGLAETRHVFLSGNDLPDRFREGFTIAELGFGTGLNLLASWMAWENHGMTTPLRYISFEAFPMKLSDMQSALAHWPELGNYAMRLIDGLSSSPTGFEHPNLSFEMILGDARETVPNWAGTADAWFLDGFSPAKNPELWEAELLSAVAARTRSRGSAATYSAAGHVRQKLADAGFEVTRIPGFGRKRHMTKAVMP